MSELQVLGKTDCFSADTESQFNFASVMFITNLYSELRNIIECLDRAASFA